MSIYTGKSCPNCGLDTCHTQKTDQSWYLKCQNPKKEYTNSVIKKDAKK